MPRLPFQLLHQAAHQHPLLPLLLRECRDLRSAQNELRWLSEHVEETSRYASSKQASTNLSTHPTTFHRAAFPTTLRDLATRRARGYPLQYLLGTQPFGDLEILCRPGVLIPRPETETYTLTLGNLLKNIVYQEKLKPLRILDLCTGTGCIPLLLHSILRPPAPDGADTNPSPNLNLDILGLDISPTAINLAHKNLQHNITQTHLHADAVHSIHFSRANVLELGEACLSLNANHSSPNSDLPHPLRGKWDIITSNPPYISPLGFRPGGTTSRSVRIHEPKLALVPPDDFHTAKLWAEYKILREDVFYFYLVNIFLAVRARGLIMEVGGGEQARRVRGIVERVIERFGGDRGDYVVEVWNDDGVVSPLESEEGDQVPSVPESRVSLRSEDRAMMVWKGRWKDRRLNDEI